MSREGGRRACADASARDTPQISAARARQACRTREGPPSQSDVPLRGIGTEMWMMKTTSDMYSKLVKCVCACHPKIDIISAGRPPRRTTELVAHPLRVCSWSAEAQPVPRTMIILRVLRARAGTLCGPKRPSKAVSARFPARPERAGRSRSNK